MTQGMVRRYCITCDKAHIHVYHQHNCHTDTSRETPIKHKTFTKISWKQLLQNKHDILVLKCQIFPQDMILYLEQKSQTCFIAYTNFPNQNQGRNKDLNYG